MGYTDPDSLYTPTIGSAVPVTWLEAVADDLNFLVDPDRARGHRSSAQTLTTASPANVLWNAEQVDTNNLHSLVTNTDRFVAQVAGLYRVECRLSFAPNATGTRSCELYKYDLGVADSVRWDVDSATSPSGSVNARTFVAGLIPLAVNEYVYAVATQTSGGDLDLVAGLDSCWMSVSWTGTT